MMMIEAPAVDFFQDGRGPLLAYKIARRVAEAPNDRWRRLMWYLQAISQEPDGLKAFAQRAIASHFDRLGTPGMHESALRQETVFRGQDLKRIEDELDPLESLSRLDGRDRPHDKRRLDWATGEELIKRCMEEASSLPALLAGISRKGPFHYQASWFKDLEGAIFDTMESDSERLLQSIASTSISKRIFDALDYLSEAGGLSIIYGSERIGKTAAADAYTRAKPHRARIISLQAASNETSFFHEIGRALGCGWLTGITITHVKNRIAEALSNRDLMLIFDEAHNLFGTTARGSVRRLEFIRTAFTNQGVPVCLIMTPQFVNRMNSIEKVSDFNFNQLRGRVTEFLKLPDKPTREDLVAVAKHLLPECDANSLRALVEYARGSEYHFQAISKTAAKAQFLAKRDGSISVSFDHVSEAIGQSLFCDDHFAAAMDGSRTPRRRRKAATARSVKHDFNDRETDLRKGQDSPSRIARHIQEPPVPERTKETTLAEI